MKWKYSSPSLSPPGVRALLSPGQVFLLAVIDTSSNTLSARAPSMPLGRRSTRTRWVSVPPEIFHSNVLEVKEHQGFVDINSLYSLWPISTYSLPWMSARTVIFRIYNAVNGEAKDKLLVRCWVHWSWNCAQWSFISWPHILTISSVIL